QHVAGAQAGQHLRADLAGAGAGILVRAVLSPQGDGDALLLDQGLHRPQVGEGRVHRHVDRRHVLWLQAQTEVAHQVQRFDVVVVHLPVPADERAAGGHERGALDAWRKASRAGRSPPRSMKLSEAPPPVERKPTRSARPSSSRALALSPPPTTEKAGLSATAWATTRVPEAKRLSSKAPMGPFHRTVPAWPTTSAKVDAASGPMSRPVQPSARSQSVTLHPPRGSTPSEGRPKGPPGSRARMSLGRRISGGDAR